MAADSGGIANGFRAEIEGDKCCSHEDLPPVSVGNDIDVDCHGDKKDDYVLVNGSDVVEDRCESVSDLCEGLEGSGTNGNVDDLSEVCNGNPVERVGNKEMYCSELSVDSLEKAEGYVINGDHHFEVVNCDGGMLNNEVKIDDLKSENRVIVEAVSDGKIEDGELLRENEEINLQSETIVENGKSGMENGGITQVEGEVFMKESESEVVVENCPKPLTNWFHLEESCVLNVDDCNSLVNGITTTVVSDGDKSCNMLEPCATSSANNELQSEIPCELAEDQINEHEPPKSEAEEYQIAEVDVQSHVADLGRDVEPLDCKHQLIHEDVVEMQPSHNDSDTHLPDSSDLQASDVEVKESLVDDAIAVNKPSDYQQHELQLAHGECEKHGGVEVEAKYQQPELKGEYDECGVVELEAKYQQPELKLANEECKELVGVDADAMVVEQGELELHEVAGNQEPSSNNFEAAIISEAPETSKGGEVKSQTVMSSAELEGTDNENGVGSGSAWMERVVCDGGGNDGISDSELPAEVDRGVENSVENVQSDTTDKPSIDPDMEKVDANEALEFVAEEAEDHESLVEDSITMDQVAEDSGSVDVEDKEIVLEVVGLERNVEVEEDTRQSKLNEAMYILGAATSDLCGAEALENQVSSDVIQSRTISVSGEGSDAADGELCRPVDTAVCLLVPSKLDSIAEQEQGDSVDYNTSPRNNVENSGPPLHVPDAKLQKTSGSDVDVMIKSNGMSNNIWNPMISFGSFECEAPFSYVDVNSQPKVLNRSVVLTSSMSKVEPSDGASLLTSEAGKATEHW